MVLIVDWDNIGIPDVRVMCEFKSPFSCSGHVLGFG